MKLTLPALLLVLGSVAGGCSGAETETAAEPGGDPPVDGDPDPDPDDDEAEEAEWSSPIDEALGGAGELVEEAEHRARHVEIEDRKVACMAQEGFTYHPASMYTEAERARSDLPPDEFAATYGFGFTTMDGSGTGTGDDPVEDPNAAMLAEMSQPERDAWHVALSGSGGDLAPDASGEESAPPLEDEAGGCLGQAMAEMNSEDTDDPDVAAAFEPLLREIASVYDQIQRDPRLTTAAETYAGCMADAGHPGYSVHGDDPPSPTGAVLDRLNAAVDSAGGGDPGGETLAGGGEFSAIPADVLAELRAFEVELAVADRPCRDAYDRVEREVMFEHESRWVEANRDELEAYRDAMSPEGAA